LESGSQEIKSGGANSGTEVARVSGKPSWLARIEQGNAFNAERSVAYPYSEVYVNKAAGGGYYRLDSYNPTSGEIVSRKFTQFSEIQDNTGIGYLNEMTSKYPAGATIANVPSSGVLSGQLLRGQQILEVPVQLKPIPQSVLDTANRSSILIRDVKGKVY
jgi:filamentous hemagglutinin